MSVPDDPVLVVFHRVADEVSRRLGAITDWGMSGARPGQYLADVAVDDVAIALLLDAGFGVLSEESGHSAPERDRVVVIDPIDGSTNASRAIPWFATALCLVDDAGPATALVVNQASGQRIEAVRGGGAWTGERRLQASGRRSPDGAVVGVNGRPPADPGWWQFRAFGASALDLALVAGGSLDGFVDFDIEAHGVWDYLASTLICTEAGACVADAGGRELAAIDHDARRTPVAAATPELLDALVALRQA